MNFKFYVLFSVLLSIVLFPVKNASPDDQLARIINGIGDRYGEISGLTSDYTRESISKTMAMLKVADRHDLAKGKLFFKPPNFLRLEQASPQEELLLTNSETLWWYIPIKREVYKYPVEKFGKELQLLSSILKGMKGITDDFLISLGPGKEVNASLLMLSPKQPSQEIDHLEVEIDKENFSIKQVSVYNNISGVTKFFFKNWEQRNNFNKDFFSFSPPPGTRVIEK